MDRDMLFSLAETNKTLVRWAQDHSYADREGLKRSTAYMTAHYSLFVQLRNELLEDRCISKSDAERATAIADYPFSAKARRDMEARSAVTPPAPVKSIAEAVSVPSLAPFPLHPSPFESQKSM